jgi:ABC-type multidrug transport system ATPase subunit
MQNLWGISGKIAEDLFEGLFAFAISEEIENQNKIEYELYGSLMVRDLFGSHYKLDSSNVLLFLDTLLCDDLLESIDITWGDGFSIDKLSEGEKQIILSIGLSLVLNKKNILFLLDEPDISLHPKWQQDFISNFTKGLNEESMAVITTHSPSVASDLFDNNLYLIRKGKIITKAFKYYGKNVDDILCDYFGLESTRNKDVAKRINYLWEKINNNEFDNAEFKRKKDELKRIIGSDDPEITAMELDILRKSNEKDK